ncbi:hypothetical protein BCR44DRAFT_54582 [Catenaria anguillulae PL171]|uniref:Uncharacterized protein n=1 Tax=Catenaria anguillulae PL171 TaxID=765915 RepID=A0A1Y2HPZ6_9FUNG|nr:hypothetical protein BCR44DRAFT_54582 [Catenaria anguillulae PL171]
MFKSTLLTTLLAVLLVASTASAHPAQPARERPPNDPTATLTYADNAGTVRLVVPGKDWQVAETCLGLQGDRGVVYAEVLTRYLTGDQRQAYNLQLYPDWDCKENDPATGHFKRSLRVMTYDGQGKAMTDEDGKVFIPKSAQFFPAYRE